MEASFTLKVMKTKELNTDMRVQIISLCEDAHGADFSKLFEYLPWDGLHVIGYYQETMVAHAVRTTRWAQPEGLPPLKTAYIDAVSTRVEMQGRGIGSAVMRRIVAEAVQEDYHICVLETDKPRFYTRLGWEIWRGPLAGRSKNGLVPTPEAQGHVLVMRLPRAPAMDLTGLLTIEDQGRIW